MAPATGFSLIELLVAVLITSTALLGLSALQMVALRHNGDALQRVEALLLAENLSDRIRAASGSTPLAGAAYQIGFAVPPPAAADCVVQACSPAQMAAFDLAIWKCQLGAFRRAAQCEALRRAGALRDAPGLPQGDGSVSTDAAGAARIRVRWLGSDGRLQNVTIVAAG